jgi:myosin heavy subunit
MLIVQREFLRVKDGTIQLQALYRGRSTRKELASIKIQTQYRKYTKRSLFCNLRSATIALQCRQRCKIAKKELGSLKGEQKDIGKLKQNNEKLKLEMASLKAMLSAQAQGSANRAESEKELKEKELEIEKLEKRIAKLEVELEKEKALVKKLETDLETERARSNDKKEQISILREQNQNLQSRAPPSPMRNQSAPLRHSRTKSSSQLLPPSSPRSTQDTNTLQTATSATATFDLAPNPIDQQVLADQKALVARLEGELEKERNARRDADGEVIKLRAEMNGVKLDDSDVEALLPIVKDSRSIEEMKEAIAFPNLSEKGDIGSPHAIAQSSFDSREENASR